MQVSCLHFKVRSIHRTSVKWSIVLGQLVRLEIMKAILERAFRTAVEAAQPAKVLLEHLPNIPKGRTVVVGAGKAASNMALAFEQAWQGECSGVVVRRYRSAYQSQGEASHRAH